MAQWRANVSDIGSSLSHPLVHPNLQPQRHLVLSPQIITYLIGFYRVHGQLTAGVGPVLCHCWPATETSVRCYAGVDSAADSNWSQSDPYPFAFMLSSLSVRTVAGTWYSGYATCLSHRSALESVRRWKLVQNDSLLFGIYSVKRFSWNFVNPIF